MKLILQALLLLAAVGGRLFINWALAQLVPFPHRKRSVYQSKEGYLDIGFNLNSRLIRSTGQVPIAWGWILGEGSGWHQKMHGIRVFPPLYTFWSY
ncbi:hypothetical protein Tco_0409393 [Tanacetum coccineum]